MYFYQLYWQIGSQLPVALESTKVGHFDGVNEDNWGYEDMQELSGHLNWSPG